MPRNGSGTYTAPALPGSWNPATTGSSATPADWNTLLADLSTALSGSVAADGQTTITANLPMANHKITGLADATAQTDALNQQSALYLIDQQDATAVAFIDFTNIAATVNNLTCLWEVRPGTNNVNILLQTYGADGILDTGGADYYFLSLLVNSVPTTAFDALNSSSMRLAPGVSSGTTGVSGQFSAANIQAATFTKFVYQMSYLDQGGALAVTGTGTGVRVEADRITGVRLSVSGGVFTGKVTLFGSV